MLWWWSACRTDGSGHVPDGSEPPDDIAPGHTAEPPGLHSGDPGTPGVPPTLSDVTGALHPEFPSVVVVSWTQDTDATVHLAFTVDGVERASPDRALGAGTHEELILGVPYDADTTWRVVAENRAGEDTSAGVTTHTGPVPPGLPLPVSVLDTGSDPAIPWVLLSMNPDGGDFGSRWWAMIVDRQGRPVWARQAAPRRMTMHPRVTWGGDALLLDQNSYWATFDGGTAGTVEELTLDGVVRHTFVTPGLHHPHTPLPDGSLAYGAIEWPYRNEYLVVVHRDGTTETLFDCEAWLATIGEGGEYCGSNTLNYDEASDTWIYSFYSFDTILHLDGGGTPLGWFGNVTGSWAFDPPSSQFWYQHGGHLRATDGALATSTYDARNPDELVVRVYELDPGRRTLHQIEAYGEGEGVYGEQMGEVSELPSGDELHNYGTLPRVREFTRGGRRRLGRLLVQPGPRHRSDHPDPGPVRPVGHPALIRGRTRTVSAPPPTTRRPRGPAAPLPPPASRGSPSTSPPPPTPSARGRSPTTAAPRRRGTGAADPAPATGRRPPRPRWPWRTAPARSP